MRKCPIQSFRSSERVAQDRRLSSIESINSFYSSTVNSRTDLEMARIYAWLERYHPKYPLKVRWLTGMGSQFFDVANIHSYILHWELPEDIERKPDCTQERLPTPPDSVSKALYPMWNFFCAVNMLNRREYQTYRDYDYYWFLHEYLKKHQRPSIEMLPLKYDDYLKVTK